MFSLPAPAPAAAVPGDGCHASCPLAIAAYYFSEGSNLTFIASIFGIGGGYQALLPYNPAITNPDYVVTGDRVHLRFPCSCLALPAVPPASTFVAGAIPYPLSLSRAAGGDTYDAVAAANYANLTTAAWLHAINGYPPGRIPGDGRVNVTVNCSCGDERVSPHYKHTQNACRILEDRRRSLTPEMVEMLTCIKDWELVDARAQHAVENSELEASFVDLYLDDSTSVAGGFRSNQH